MGLLFHSCQPLRMKMRQRGAGNFIAAYALKI
jgi:hypothetical protein